MVKRIWWMKCIPSSKLYKCRTCYGKYLVIHFMNMVIIYRKSLVNFRECFSIRDYKVQKVLRYFLSALGSRLIVVCELK